MKNIFLIGGGGHCHSCIDVIEQEGVFKICGIFDKAENVGKDILGYKIIGSDIDLESHVSNKNYYLITVGQIKSSEVRVNLFDLLKSLGANLATVISPRSYVSSHSKIGEGTIILHDALVNTNAIVGNNCIINTKALVEHDSIINDHCHISTGAIVNGSCKVNARSFIGSNSVLRQGVTIDSMAVITAGSFFNGSK